MLLMTYSHLFKWNSWVPLGEYPTYIATYTTNIWITVYIECVYSGCIGQQPLGYPTFPFDLCQSKLLLEVPGGAFHEWHDTSSTLLETYIHLSSIGIDMLVALCFEQLNVVLYENPSKHGLNHYGLVNDLCRLPR